MTVAAYIAFAGATERGISLLKLMSDFGVSVKLIPMGKDSQSAMRINYIKHLISCERTNYLELR
jgi:hypothetical protein